MFSPFNGGDSGERVQLAAAEKQDEMRVSLGKFGPAMLLLVALAIELAWVGWLGWELISLTIG